MYNFQSGYPVGSEQWCVDLSAFINDAIDADSIAEYEEAERRKHLGVSEIGHPCARKIWYGFRWVKMERHTGRMYRLFNRGHAEEHKIIHRLRRIGIEATDIDPATGKQYRIQNDFNRHMGGSLDSLLTITWPGFPIPNMLGEYKTHSKKSFDKLEKSGVRATKPQHYTQMCIYGKRTGQQYGLYVPVCKDDDRIKVSVVKLDYDHATMYEEKGCGIIESQTPPRRISEKITYPECRLCPYAGPCHLGKPVEKNCRSCRNAYPLPDGTWRCRIYHNGQIPDYLIAHGCPDYWQPIA